MARLSMWGSMKYQVIPGRGEHSLPSEDVHSGVRDDLTTPRGVAPRYYVRPLQGQAKPPE